MPELRWLHAAALLLCELDDMSERQEYISSAAMENAIYKATLETGTLRTKWMGSDVRKERYLNKLTYLNDKFYKQLELFPDTV